MKHRQFVTYVITLVFAGLFSCANPTSSTSSQYTVTVKGTVLNAIATRLDSVHIVLWIPFSQDTAKSDGTFSISFTAEDKSTISDSITFSRSGFLSTTKYFSYGSTANTIDLSAVVLKGVTSAQDSLTASHTSQRAGQIVFISSSASNLSILGAGGVNATNLTFEVRDSLGVPVDTANQVNVNFKFINQPDLLTQLNLDSVHTNSAGQVTVQLSSGLKAGLASIQAYAAVKDRSNPKLYDTLSSQIVSIPIYGGYPDSAHLSIGSTLFNIPGGVIINFQDKISVLVGDKYGNPVHPGTPVYFSSTGGSIEGEGLTDNDGIASVTLFTGNPVPSNGYAIVTAQVATSHTAGGTASPGSTLIAVKGRVSADGVVLNKTLIPKPLANHSSKIKPANVSTGQLLSDSIPILFSGKSTMSSPNNNFIIPVSSSAQVNYSVSDLNGNPLVGGSTIQVTASGPASSSVTLSGDVTVNIPDTQDKKFSQFQLSMKDNRTIGLNLSQALTLTIAVTSVNGNNKLILSGNLSGTGGVTVDSNIVSRIVLQNPSTDSIVVAGLGTTNTDDIKFKVYNTFGFPAKNLLVSFKLPLALNGGEYVSPASALTDTGGNVKTTLTSGTKSGEVLVTASVTKDSLTLTSDPKVIYIIIPPASRLAAQVLYLGATATDIYVDGVGALENSILSYQVTDSLGIPIDRQRRVGVTYNVQFFPNSTIAGGTPPSVIPNIDSTDDNGLLHTSVVSGTEAGVVQVVAHINVPGRATLISQPVKITVHAGFPDQAHFTIVPSHVVFAGLDDGLNTIPFSVVVGDTFSNPVAKGTAVYFHSQAGVIQTGSSDFNAYTDQSGKATVSLLTSNPLPLFPPFDYTTGPGKYAAIGGRTGYFWVYAQTQGHNNTNVIDSFLVASVGGGITVTGIPDTTVTVYSATNSSLPISITVKDGYGNPLPDGTTITANIVPPANTLSGFQMGVSGDISSDLPVTLPDAAYARFPGHGITDFTFRVVNQSVPTTVASGVAVVVRITVQANARYLWTSTYSFTALNQ